MPILSIDSSNGYSNILIMNDDSAVIAEAVSGFHEKHSILVFKQIDQLLLKTGLKLCDLKGIAVSLGPGSFTGVRVSITIAKTLSFCLGLNIIGVGTLFALAYPFLENSSGAEYIVALTDTIKHNYYVSVFVRKNGKFVQYLKMDRFDLEKLKIFITGLDANTIVVYGAEQKDNYDVLAAELKESTDCLNPTVFLNYFDLLKIPYYSARYALEKKLKNSSKYTEGLSPYYVYSEGAF